MELTNNKQKLTVKAAAYLLIISSIYVVLIIGDYIAKRMTININPQAKQIEVLREKSEDNAQRRKAIEKGYKPIYYPELLENDYQFRSIADRYKVAPLAPQANTNLYLCNEGYGLIKYRSDKYGFRNKDEDWDQKPDIALIGDSYTHGSCVEQEQTIAGQLSDKFNVLNLGTGNNHTIHYAALAKIFLPTIKPQTVVLIFYANDNGVGTEESYFYRQYFLKNINYDINFEKSSLNQNLQSFYDEITPLIEKRISNETLFMGQIENYWHRGIKYLSLSNLRNLISAYIHNVYDSKQLDFGSKLAIDTLVNVCREISCRPIVAYIPNSDFWRPDPRGEKYERLLHEYAMMASVDFWSAKEKFKTNETKDIYAVKGPHLSPLGYSIVAKGIKEQIGKK